MRMRAAGFSRSTGVEKRPHGDADDQPEQRRYHDREAQCPRPAPAPVAAAVRLAEWAGRRGRIRARAESGLRISRSAVRVLLRRTGCERVGSFRCHGASMVVMDGLSVTAGGRLAGTIPDPGVFHNGTAPGLFLGRRAGTCLAARALAALLGTHAPKKRGGA